ncbi:hypothetical protein IPL68_05165 [Candidatus Saccharibacteria bacterium]|nr:MAG: hypothetical protein IPL68_05165 [Candidatus Saccharibacteria bacterium]
MQVPGLEHSITIGWWIIPLFTLVVVATANAVNISDGLDGLAGGLTTIAFCNVCGYCCAGTEVRYRRVLRGHGGGADELYVVQCVSSPVLYGDVGSFALRNGSWCRSYVYGHCSVTTDYRICLCC